MKLSPVIAAMRTRCTRFSGNVAGAAEFKSLPETGKMRLPAAYVVPAEDVAADQKSLTDYWQNVTEGFSVVVVLDNTRDERGQAAAWDVVHEIRAELWKCFLGWQPESAGGPVCYAGGQLLSMDRARLYYQFDFMLTREITEEDTRQQDDLNMLDEFTEMSVDIDYIGTAERPDGHPEHHITLTPGE